MRERLDPPYCTLCGGPPTRERKRIVCGDCGAVLKEKPPSGPIRGYE